MKTANSNTKPTNSAYSLDIELQNIFLPALKGYEETLLNLHCPDHKAPLSDWQYINDLDYINSVAQY